MISEEILENINEKLKIENLINYVLQGFVIALAVYILPNRKTSYNEIFIVTLISSVTFLLLDIFIEDITKYVRLGLGIGIGLGLTNLNTDIPYLQIF